MNTVATTSRTLVTGNENEQEIAVKISGLSKFFTRANGVTITPVDDISLEVRRGEILVLLGPSGCGKTTLLRCIAGLEQPSSGSINIHGEPYFDAAKGIDRPPEKRRLGMIFQSYALWPHMTVRENVAYPLKAAKVPKSEIAGRVLKALELVGIPEVIDQHPGRLSGGQQQRVALARALVAEPELILFDEPLSNVDAKVRTDLRAEILEMQRRIGFTAIYVTHDQVEAMELAHRIAVLRDGHIEQLADAKTIYTQPATRHVAHFVGSANEIPAQVLSFTELAVGRTTLRVPHTDGVHAGGSIGLVFRPEVAKFLPPTDLAPDRHLVLDVEIMLERFLGSYIDYFCRTDEGVDIRVTSTTRTGVDAGDRTRLAIPVDGISLFAAEDQPGLIA